MTSSNSNNKNRLALIEEMLVDDPHDPFLNYAAALEHHKAGDLNIAIELLESLVENQPDYVGTYYQLGKLHEETENLEQARVAYEKGIKQALLQADHKILGELRQALMALDDDD